MSEERKDRIGVLEDQTFVLIEKAQDVFTGKDFKHLDSRPMTLAESFKHNKDLRATRGCSLKVWLPVKTDGESLFVEYDGKRGVLFKTNVVDGILGYMMKASPSEYILALQNMMAQAAHIVFMDYERFRAEVHDPNTPKNLLIQMPVPPKTTPMSEKINGLLETICVQQRDSVLDDMLKSKDAPEADGKGTDGNTDKLTSH